MDWTVWPSRHPAPVLLAALGVTLLAIVGAFQIQAEVDFVDTVPIDEDVSAYRTMVERLDGVRFVAVHMPFDPASGHGHLRTDQGFDSLVYEQRNLTQHLETGMPAGTFSHSLSVYEAMRAGHYTFQKIATAGNPSPSAYSLPSDPATWDAVRDEVRGGAADDVLAADGSSALALFFFSTTDNYEARRLAGDVGALVDSWSEHSGAQHPATQEHAATGLLYSSNYVDERNRDDLTRWGLVAAAGVGVVLLIAFRRPADAAIAVGSLGLATVWTFGAMGWLGLRISFLTMFLAPIVMGVGIDYAIHILERYRQERADGRSRRAAMDRASAHTGRAVRVAALTTALGLALLLAVPAPLFAEIGGMAAVGIVMALVAGLTVAPALRAAMPDRPPARRRHRLGPMLARVAQRVSRHRRAVVAGLAAMVLAAGTLAIAGTRVESGSAENEFPADDPVLLTLQRVEKEYGSFQRAYVIVQGDLTDPDAIRALFDASRSAADLPLYHGAGSIADLLIADAKTDQGVIDIALQGATQPGDASYLPTTHAETRDRLDRLFSDPLWRTLAPFTITRDYDLAVVSIQLEPAQDPDVLSVLRDRLQALGDAVAAELDDEFAVAAAGAPVNRAAVAEGTPMNVSLAVFGVAGVGFVVLGIAWVPRRGAQGLAVAATAAGIVLAAALLLLASIPLLDMAYAALHAWGLAPANTAVLTDMFLLAFALTVAMGVDDTVHIASRYWESRDAGGTQADALSQAFSRSGHAITVTTATTVVAFSLLAGAYFLQNKNLAILAALGAAYAYALTLLVLPIVLGGRRAVRTRKARSLP